MAIENTDLMAGDAAMSSMDSIEMKDASDFIVAKNDSKDVKTPVFDAADSSATLPDDVEAQKDSGDAPGPLPGSVAIDPAAVRVPLPRSQFILVFIGLALSILLAALDQTIVATALSAIVHDFGNQSLIPWIGSAYLLTATSFAALYGKFADIFGRKPVFLFAIIIFEAGSALCGAATSMEMLIVGRAVAGVGGGGIFSLVLIIISDIVSIQDRGKFQGIIGAVFGLASVIGPLIGGAFSDNVSWRWCFYINLPVGVITVLTVTVFLRFPAPEGAVGNKLKRIDYLGTVFLFAFVTCIITPVQLGGTTWAWNSSQVISLFVVAAVMAAVFIYTQVKVSTEPIIPPSLFMNRSVPLLLCIALCLGAAFFSAVYYISLFFQVSYGDSATRAGIETIPLIFGVVLLSIISGQVVSRTGFYRPFLYAGGLIMIAGVTLTSTLSPSSSRVEQVFYLLILGIGVGSLIQIRVIALQAAVDGPRIAVATAVSQFCQTLGGAVGVAIVGTVFNNVLITNLNSKPELLLFLQRSGFDPADINLPRVRGILSSIPNATVELNQLIDSFSGAFNISYKVIIAFPVTIFLLALGVEQFTFVARKPGGPPPPAAE